MYASFYSTTTSMSLPVEAISASWIDPCSCEPSESHSEPPSSYSYTTLDIAHLLPGINSMHVCDFADEMNMRN